MFTCKFGDCYGYTYVPQFGVNVKIRQKIRKSACVGVQEISVAGASAGAGAQADVDGGAGAVIPGQSLCLSLSQ